MFGNVEDGIRSSERKQVQKQVPCYVSNANSENKAASTDTQATQKPPLYLPFSGLYPQSCA